MLIPISQLQFKKMPIVNGIYPNHLDDSDDFEDFCGMEHFPYVLLREDAAEEPMLVPQRQVIPPKESTFSQLLKKWNFRKFAWLF